MTWLLVLGGSSAAIVSNVQGKQVLVFSRINVPTTCTILALKNDKNSNIHLSFLWYIQQYYGWWPYNSKANPDSRRPVFCDSRVSVMMSSLFWFAAGMWLYPMHTSPQGANMQPRHQVASSQFPGKPPTDGTEKRAQMSSELLGETILISFLIWKMKSWSWDLFIQQFLKLIYPNIQCIV